jgi:hypothetical protein
MGQYQEWLLAQEIEKRLQIELEALERQTLYLKERIITLEQTMPARENVILQALQAYLYGQEQYPEPAGANGEVVPVQEETPAPVQPREQVESAPAPSGSYSSLADMPGDMLAFFASQRKTDPDFSGWRAREQDAEDAEHPVDAETRRLNENIQRWFERWHREITSRAQTEARDGQ